MSRKSFGWRGPAGLLAALIAFSACQAATPTGTPAPVATAAVTAAPSPTSSADVVALFAERTGDLDSGVMNLDGTATIGLVQVKFNGNSTFSGPDSSGRMTTTVAAVSTDVLTVQVAGKKYQKTGDGPWLEVPISQTSALQDELSKSATASLTDAGTEERNGQTVHKLVPGSSSSFDPASILSSVAGVEDVHAELAFYATDDGTPVGASIDATWTQTVGTTKLDGSLTFDVRFSHLGQSQTIRAPEDVWSVFKSTRFHYSIAHPAEWTFYKAKAVDELDAPYLAYVIAKRQKAEGANLNQWAKGEIATTKIFLRTKAV